MQFDDHESKLFKQPSELRRELSKKLSYNIHRIDVSNTSDDNKLHLAKQNSAFFALSTLSNEYAKHFKPTLIIGLLYFRAATNIENVRELLYKRLVLEFERFRSILYMDQKHQVFFQELCPDDIDMEYHVEEINADGWTSNQIHSFVGSLYNEKKDPNNPLWKFYVLNNIQGHGSLVIANIDHAIGDGISMVEVLLSLLDDHDTINVNPATKPPTVKVSSSLSYLDYVMTMVAGVWNGFASIQTPSDSPNKLKYNDVYNGPVETSKIFSFADIIPLQKVKELRTKIPSATVNDILTSVLNMCIKRYFEEANPEIVSNKRSKITALFLINARKRGIPVSLSLGNRYCFGKFKFFFDYKTRLELVWMIKRQIDVIKISPEAYISDYLSQTLLSLINKDQLIKAVAEGFRKFTLMLSNVQGPSVIAKLGDNYIDKINFTALGPLPVYCGIVSYNGQISLGLTCDDRLHVNPENVTKYFKTEFDALYYEVMSLSETSPNDLLPPSKSNKFSNLVIYFVGIVFLGSIAWYVIANSKSFI